MAEIKRYIEILTESLRKKKKILEDILEENEKQAGAIRDEESMEAFEATVTAKSKLLWDMEALDNGFETVYERVKEGLEDQKEKYKAEISEMQALISEITDLSVRIQASEQRNKKLAEGYFSGARRQIRESKKSVRVASDYYKSMSGSTDTGPRMVDQKK